jgi:hypothetical protein
MIDINNLTKSDLAAGLPTPSFRRTVIADGSKAGTSDSFTWSSDAAGTGATTPNMTPRRPWRNLM